MKATGEELEGFVDWTNLSVSQSTKEREVEMSGLIAGFVMQMRKRAVNAQGGTTSSLEVPGNKRSRSSRSNEEVQDDPTVIVVDSQE